MRNRLAAVNANRTVVVRGAVRPAVIAEEDELAVTEGLPLDCFVLRWVEEQVDSSEPIALHAMRCEVQYATRGTDVLAGIDRGRVLCAMDAELKAMLYPQQCAQTNYGVTPTMAMVTRVFWSEAGPSKMLVVGDRLQRTVGFTAFALEEVLQ